jgi:hypothetical protein
VRDHRVGRRVGIGTLRQLLRLEASSVAREGFAEASEVRQQRSGVLSVEHLLELGSRVRLARTRAYRFFR